MSNQSNPLTLHERMEATLELARAIPPRRETEFLINRVTGLLRSVLVTEHEGRLTTECVTAAHRALDAVEQALWTILGPVREA